MLSSSHGLTQVCALNVWLQGTRIMSIVAMMMSILVALVCTYIVVMLPCTAPRFDQRTCDLFHVM